MTDTATTNTPTTKLAKTTLNQLFYKARTHNGWLEKPVSKETLEELYALLRMGSTSANGCPARFVFLTTPESKERLLPALMPKNAEKTKNAPVTVLVAL